MLVSEPEKNALHNISKIRMPNSVLKEISSKVGFGCLDIVNRVRAPGPRQAARRLLQIIMSKPAITIGMLS
ncbi:MAG: hypothetical protein WA632_03030, partial [Gallionella sp.]